MSLKSKVTKFSYPLMTLNFIILSCEIGDIFKNTFSHRAPLVAAFEFTICRFATSVKQNSPEGTFQEFILNIPQHFRGSCIIA